MEFYDTRLALPNKVVDEEMFENVREMIKGCQKFIDGSLQDGRVAIAGPRTLLDRIKTHGNISYESAPLYGAISYFAEVDNIKITALISESQTADFVSVTALQVNSRSFSIQGKK